MDLLERLGLSDLEGVTTFPGYGWLYGPYPEEETKAFLAVAAKLVAGGAPQLTVRDLHARYDNAVGDTDYGPLRDAVGDGHDIYVCWEVEGVPSRQGKLLAHAWMESRDVPWDSKATTLRLEVERALFKAEVVPKFGLRIRCLIFYKRSH
ncbi:hypothetical protein CP49_23670 [Bradyrhizobium valentinum]|uniref:Uncharacterized protein n=1 Tax=Bradyrhizobium valentinum TaxID=1518501 RepID=A0A0R3LGS0_9BRAD|nr:hypothetical protein CP49_23670 [Bradyrhizobium valentinum]